MPLVSYIAPGRGKKFLYHKGPVIVKARQGDTTTVKIRPTGHLVDGDTMNMGDFEAQWCVTYLPALFVLADGDAPEAAEDTPGEEG